MHGKRGPSNFMRHYNQKENHPNWKGGLIKRNCLECGNEFSQKPSHIKIGEGKYCSLKCRNTSYTKNRKGSNSWNWKGGKIKRICEICSKGFEVMPHVVKKGNGRFCSRSCKTIWQILHNKKQNTSIEIKMEQELTRHGIVFQKQYPIWQAKTIPDFFIIPNICIYCDGDYWHGTDKQKTIDKKQDFILKFLGYKVYRFWEHEIKKSIKKCVNRIQEIQMKD